MASRWRVPLSDFVRFALSQDLLRLLQHEPSARQFESEGIHHMRTSTRRLRSNLRFFEPALDADWSASLRTELKWLADLLGQVRDLDVLEEHLRDDLAADAPGAPGAEDRAGLFRRLQQRREDARAELAVGLDGERYAELRLRLIVAARSPEPGPHAQRAAHEALPRLLNRSWRRFVRQARALRHDAPAEAYHDLRKRAKRARYAAEAVALAPSRRLRAVCRRQAELATRLQDILGQMQDAVVEVDFLAREANLTSSAACSGFLRRMREEKLQAARDAFERWRAELDPSDQPA